MIDGWLLERLACPRCHTPLTLGSGWLACAAGHRYPVVDDIPVMVLDDVRQTHWAATASLEEAAAPPAEPEAIAGTIDPFVADALGATCGNLYAHLIGRLPRYPIPRLDLDAPTGAAFLDLGCHWGRWCVAASRNGWRVVGLDPFLPAVRAAKRVARSLGAQASFVVGDARYLPFVAGAFDIVHSFSVLQHFAEPDVEQCAVDVARVLAPGGAAHIQMAQRWGALNLLQQARRGFRPPRNFEVRYWTGRSLEQTFSDAVGRTTLTADAFLSLNAQTTDMDLLRPSHQWIVRLSTALCQQSRKWPALVGVADSVYVHAAKRAPIG